MISLPRLLLVALLVAACASASPSSAQTGRPSEGAPAPLPWVGVLPLADRGADATLSGLGLALQERLTWMLRRQPSVSTLELEDLAQRAQRPASALAVSAVREVTEFAGALGADVLVGGSVTGDSQRVTIEIVSIEVRTGDTGVRSFTTTPAQALERVESVLAAMLAPQGVAVRPVSERDATPVAALITRARGVAAMTDASTGGGLPSLRAADGLLARATQEPSASAEAWYRFGEALLRLGDYPRAQSAFERALGLARRRGDAALELWALVAGGDAFLREGRYVEGEKRHKAALPLARLRGDRESAAAALYGLAITHFAVHGADDDSARACAEALVLWRGLGNRRGEARALTYVGSIAMGRGEYDSARQIMEEALRTARAVNDPRSELIALADLGQVAYRRGRYNEAQAFLTSALDVARASGDRQREAYVMVNLGRTLADKGNGAAAAPYARQALDLARAIGANQYVQMSLGLLGAQALAQGDYAAAQQWWEESVKAARATGSRSLEARSLHGLGEAARLQQDWIAAQSYFRASLALAQPARMRREEALALTGLGQVAVGRGDAAAAATLLGQALAVARARDLPESEWQALYGIGALHEAAGRDGDTARTYREAVDVIGRLVSRLSGPERQAFLAGQAGSRLAVYDALARVLLRLHRKSSGAGHDREAWAVLEAKKAEIVAEALGATRPEPREAEARERAAQIQVVQERAAAAESALRREVERPAGQRAARVQELTTLLARTKAEYQQGVETFLAKYPQYAARFRDQATIDPADLSRLARRLPADTLVVQYFAAPDQLYLFVVGRNDHFEIKTHAIDQATLYRLVREYRQHLSHAAENWLPWDDDGSPEWKQHVQPLRALSARLSEHLLGPIRAELARYPNLVLAPNDVLLYLPFHALTSSGRDGAPRFLAETHVVSYLTRRELVDLFTSRGGPGPERPLLAVANPDGTLKAAAAEVRTLQHLRRSVVALEGAEATKERFVGRVSQYADLHLATHGVFDLRRPELSYLVMAGPTEESQQLTVREIASLSLEEGGLVTLSACETALGEQVPGAALITLAAAFSQAGAQSIVASLWRVVDRFTRVEMETFYENISTAGRAAALTIATRRMLKDPKTRHPYYWAGFILIGGR